MLSVRTSQKRSCLLVRGEAEPPIRFILEKLCAKSIEALSYDVGMMAE